MSTHYNWIHRSRDDHMTSRELSNTFLMAVQMFVLRARLKNLRIYGLIGRRAHELK